MKCKNISESFHSVKVEMQLTLFILLDTRYKDRICFNDNLLLI